MGRTARSTVVDKENTPRVGVKTRLRSAKTPLAMVDTPRKALTDLNRNLPTHDLTPMKKKKLQKAAKELMVEKDLVPSLLQKESTVTSLESERHEVAQSSNAPKSVSDTVTADQSSNCQAQDGNTGVSARPPRFQHLSDAQWESLQLTAGPDDAVFWWRAAEERREALAELIEENVKVHQQNRLLRQELSQLRQKESEASYFSLMARLWELESAT